MRQELKSVVIIGSGNVANQLAMQFQHVDIDILQVCSRNSQTGMELSNALNCAFTTDMALINPSADLYLLAVNDDSLANVRNYFTLKLHPNQIIVHTSGATPADVLSYAHNHYGCIWPILSIQAHETYDWTKVPLAIVGSDDQVTQSLNNLLSKISKKSFTINDEDKTKMHLTATIANNFTNHIYAVTEEYCIKNKLDFKLLVPMLIQQATKLQSISPSLTPNLK